MYIESITLGLTNNCNFSCAYCFEGEKNKKRISIKTAKTIIDWLLSDEVSGPVKQVEVSFFGGEPLLELEKIKKIVPYTNKKAASCGKEVAFGMTTNGSLFTKEVASYWKDNNLGVLFSCDGVMEAHDMLRRTSSNKSTFNTVEKNIDNIIAVSNSKEVRMTVAPSTSMYMTKSIKYLSERGFESICAFYAEEVEWSKNDILKHEENAFEVGEFYIEVLNGGLPLRITPLDNYIRNNLNERINTLDNNLCGAGRGYLGIGVNGTIFPCHRFTSMFGFQGAFPIGDVINGIDEKKRIPFLRMKKKLMLGCDIECDECTLQKKCTGGCIAANYQTTGHIAKRPSAARYHEIIWNEVAKSIIEHFKKNKCKEFSKRYQEKENKKEKNQKKLNNKTIC